MQPTPEQSDAVDLFGSGLGLAIEAGAGTGKTTTLQLLGESTTRRGAYMAFNRSIVEEAKRKMPGNVGAKTAHGLAFRTEGKPLAHRLEAPRMRSMDIARALHIDPITVRTPTEVKVLQPGTLAGHVMKAVARFCQSADELPGPQHFEYIHGIDVHDGAGKRAWANNDEVRRHLEAPLRKAWHDLIRPDGTLRFSHDVYLKLFQLHRRQVGADFLLVDEAQDLSPVMLAIAEAQADTQLVFVGDSQQQIYGWRGAVNALENVPADSRTYLTQSFRFGPAIAEVANAVLSMIGAPIRLRGHEPIDSALAHVASPAAILTRTNAEAVSRALGALGTGGRPHLIGGGKEVVLFARAAKDLKEEGSTWHPELACFDSWGQVQEYCLVPQTRVLTADLEWRPCSRLGVGDEIVAFDEHCAPGNGGRRYRTATVESKDHLNRPCRRVWMADGREVIASVEHRWLVRSGKSLRWKPTGSLRPGDEIASLGTWEPDESRDGGWLAGILDGEGWLGRTGLAFAQKEGVVLERARWALKERGITFHEGQHDTGVVHVDLTGQLADRLRVLGSLRPDRLLEKARVAWEDVRVAAGRCAVVQGVEDVGERMVVALGTSTRTLIAEGLLSHNCAQDPQGDELRLLVELIDEHGPDKIIAALDAMPPEREASVVISTAHKAKGREWDSVKLADDFGDEEVDGVEEWRLLYVAATRAQRILDLTGCAPLRALLEDEGRAVTAADVDPMPELAL